MTNQVQRPSDTPAVSGGVPGMIKSGLRILAVLAMVIVLGFGARTTFAAPEQLACPFDPPAGELGACTTNQQCDDDCFALHGTTPGGCTNVGGDNCCRCPTR